MSDDWVERYHQEKQAEQIEQDEKGGPGSGHWGHAGRPGKVGGSVSGSVAVSIRTGRTAGARQARSKLAGMGREYDKDLASIKQEYNANNDKGQELWDRRMEAAYGSAEDKALSAEMEANFQEQARLIGNMNELERQHAQRQREAVLYVDNPSQFTAKEVSRFKGERATAIREGVSEFRKMTGTGTVDDKSVDIRAGGRGRSHCEWGGKEISLTTSARQATTIHELGHWLEMNDDRVWSKASDFLDRRTAGETPQPLNKLQPGRRYDPDERARPDKFSHPYMGKVYATKGQHRATEIVSMGMEEMWKNPAGFAASDPEYFDLIYNLLRGQ